MSSGIDDRGNVVDIWVDDKPTGRIDREVCEKIEGVDMEFTYGFNGGVKEIKIAIAEGYKEEMLLSIICDMLREVPEAVQNAKDILNIYMEEE